MQEWTDADDCDTFLSVLTKLKYIFVEKLDLMRKAVYFFCAVAAAVSCGRNSEKCVTLGSLLDEMVSYDVLASYPDPSYKTMQVSSYDRRTRDAQEPGWFANDDGFGYERADTVDGRIEKVLFDEKGPGAVTRIWMTTKDKTGILRFYFDGSDSPEVVIDSYDMDRFPVAAGFPLSLTHTHYDRNIKGVGGNTFFLPLPYSSSCRITLEETSGEERIPRYYQITYRKYSPGTEVETFTLENARRLEQKIAGTGKELLESRDYSAGTVCSRTFAAGDPAEDMLELPDGSKAVRNLSVEIAGVEDMSEMPEIMKTTRIQMFFDGKECVDCPLDCFFGAGYGAPPVSGRYLYSDGKGSFSARWVMPYRSDAKAGIVKNPEYDYSVSLECNVDDYEFTDNTLYFHATYNEEQGIKVGNDYSSNDNREWNFITIKGGRGVYCGDVLTLYNHCPSWYGEGDEKIWIDDDSFPSIMGTGTEDYYNCSWAPVVPFDTPFGGAPRADEDSSHGYNTFMRTRSLDVMTFRDSLVFDLEMLSWVPGTVDYRTASYWYGDISAQAE